MGVLVLLFKNFLLQNHEKDEKIPLYIDNEDIDVVTPVFMSTDSSHEDDDRNLLNVERRKLREEVIKY